MRVSRPEPIVTTLQLALAAVAIWAAGMSEVSAQPAPATAECRRDLLVADSLLRNGRFNLERAVSASEADRCAAWRRHVDDMRRARGFYAACLAGSPRTERLAMIDDSVAQIAPALRDRCARPSGAAPAPRR